MFGDGFFVDVEIEFEEGVGFFCVMIFRRVFFFEDVCFGSNWFECKGCVYLRCYINCNCEWCELELVWVMCRVDEVFVRINVRIC